jgi:hypothetical protein
MKRLIAVAITVTMLVLVTGCGTTAKFIYPAKMSSLAQLASAPVYNKSVAILPFEDYRDDDNSNMAAMYLIPLMPFGWETYDRPDAASTFLSVASYDVTPSEDLAKATAVSFRRSNLFKNAFFTFGGERDRADFVLRGRIKIMRYKGKVFTYGLSLFGPWLWAFGAPAGSSTNQLAIELSMTNKKGEVVWDWSMDKSDWITQWIYARMGSDCKMFTYMMQDGMNDAVADLAKKMRERPDLFK